MQARIPFAQWLLPIAALLTLSACINPYRSTTPAVDPDAARTRIAALIPTSVQNRDGWAVDIFAALEALKLPPSDRNACAAIAVTQQESTFQTHPPVPRLPQIAREEIAARAARFRIPKAAVNVALRVKSPNGETYRERLAKAHTEKALSDIFDDFIGSVPLGRTLFADFNPVRTGGPMQVSIAYAEQHARDKRYPYPLSGSIRDEVFTRRGGVYFGIAHLLDYTVDYDDMLFYFADFNAGHYASRNAAFQNAAAIVSKTKLVLDGDLRLYGDRASEPSNTELALRKARGRLGLSEQEIRRDLQREKDEDFVRTRLYERVMELADQAGPGNPVPRAIVPRIKLQSSKITRDLTTEWFARRVKMRYEQCLARAPR